MAYTKSGWYTNTILAALEATAQTGTGGLNLTLATWKISLLTYSGPTDGSSPVQFQTTTQAWVNTFEATSSVSNWPTTGVLLSAANRGIGQVEGFGLELETVAFAELGFLGDGRVQLRQGGVLDVAREALRKVAGDGVAGEVGVAARIVIEPVIWSLSGILAGGRVLVLGVVPAEVNGLGETDGAAGDVGEDPVGAPAADGFVGPAGDAGGDFTAFADGQIPNAAEGELLGLVGGIEVVAQVGGGLLRIGGQGCGLAVR